MEGVLFLIGSGAVLLAVFLKRRSSAPAQGPRGEQVVHGILRSALPASEYTILRDVMLRIDGETTQIDHLVVSRFGIFIIETKDLAGSIIGAEQDGHWIQTLQHLRSEFPNPLWQNRANIRALQALLGLRAAKFHSLVVFTGKAEFRNPMPLNVMQRDRLIAYFQVRQAPLLEQEAVEQAIRTLESSRLESHVAANARPTGAPRPRRADRSPPSRPPQRHGVSPRFATRTLAGAFSLAMLATAGTLLVVNRGELPGFTTGRPAAFPSRSPPLSHSTGPGHIELHCAYAPDSGDCDCRSPDSGAVAVDFEECKARAGDAAH